MPDNLSIWRDSPAQHANDALPLGNGHLGALVYGGIQEETILLNEDTLWTGFPRTYTIPHAAEDLQRARQAVASRRNDYRAEKLCRKLQGPNAEIALPLGSLHLTFAPKINADNYRHTLSLTDAQTCTTFTANGIQIRRDVFCSYPDQILVLRMSAEQNVLPDFTVSLSSPLAHQTCATRHKLTMTGQASASANSDCSPADGMAFAVTLQANATEATITPTPQQTLFIGNARNVTIMLAAATSFNGFSKHPVTAGKSPLKLTDAILSKAKRKTVDDLLSRHKADIMPLFASCYLDLGTSPFGELPTYQRVETFKATRDVTLAALLFNYGRYLLLACSRASTQPASPYGLWNHQLAHDRPAHYDLTAATEMAYWPMGPANLSDCGEPLLKLLEELRKTGSLVASVNYNCRGWCTHHATDIWRLSCPAGNFGRLSPTIANWPMGGIWLALSLWEHCDFNPNPDFLRRKAWPILKGAAQFALDWLIPEPDEKGKCLITAPSTTPHHDEHPQETMGMAATADLSLIKELLHCCLTCAKILHLQRDPLIREIRKTVPKLLPFPISKQGKLLPWPNETEQPANSLAHCFSCFPGNLITIQETPELAKAVRKSLDEGQTLEGDSWAWETCLRARLKQGNKAWKLLKNAFRLSRGKNRSQRAGLTESLILSQPEGLISENLAVTATMAELLLQSHRQDGFDQQDRPLHVLNLLPALPDDWHQGSAYGLRARGGFKVDVHWAQNTLRKAVVKPTVETECIVDSPMPLKVTLGEDTLETRLRNGFLAFHVVPGRDYVLTPDNP